MRLYRGAPWRFAPAPAGATRLYLASEGDPAAEPAEDGDEDSEGAGKTGDYAVALGAVVVPAADTEAWPPGLLVAQWLLASGEIVDGGSHDVLRSAKVDGAAAAQPSFAEQMVAKLEAALLQGADKGESLSAGDIDLEFAEQRRLRRELARWRRAVAKQRGTL